MRFYSCALFTALITSAVIFLTPTLGEDYSYLVRNGDRITALRCLTAGRWKAFRIEGNRLGPPIDITNFKSADNSLTFTVDDATNTGYYYCVNEVDEAEIYDRYVILTNTERLRVFPFPVVRVNSTGVVTITIMFTQFDGTPEVLKTIYVYFLPEGALESERLKFDPILESRIENGVASFSFNATENGTITAEAEFRVGLDPRNHRVTSDPVHLIFEPDPTLADITINERESTDSSALNPGAVAGIVCAVLLVGAFGLGSLYVALSLYAVFKRRAGQRLREDNDNMGIAVEEEHGLDGHND